MRLFGRHPEVEEPPERPRAAGPGKLPGTSVCGIELPAGRRERSQDGPEVLWRTDGSERDLVPLWSALAARFGDTGLWPVLLEKSPHRWQLLRDEQWETKAAIDAEALIAAAWRENTAFDEQLAAMLGPFPGVGRGGDRMEGAAADAIKAVQGIGGLALVPVTRPADVPAAIGWSGAANSAHDNAALSAILRSWEARYDAILVALGFDTMHVAVRRPPVEADEVKTSAELYVFCTDVVDLDDNVISELAVGLSTTRSWMFWWD